MYQGSAVHGTDNVAQENAKGQRVDASPFPVEMVRKDNDRGISAAVSEWIHITPKIRLSNKRTATRH